MKEKIEQLLDNFKKAIDLENSRNEALEGIEKIKRYYEMLDKPTKK